MFFSRSTLAYIVCVSTLVHSFPTTTNSSLLQSGQDAQALNAQFHTLTTTSPCGNLTNACVENAIATCSNNTWDTSGTHCSRGQSCFALPNVRTGGTTLACTSEKNALSVIQSTGATGDVTGGDTTTSSSSGSASAASSSAADAPPTADSGNNNQATVTVTVTQPILSATITTTSTQTISPEQASSILSSIIAKGGQATPTAGSDAESTPCTESKMEKKRKTATSMATSAAETVEPTSTLVTASATSTDTVASRTVITLVAATETDSIAPSATAASDSSAGSSYGY